MKIQLAHKPDSNSLRIVVTQINSRVATGLTKEDYAIRGKTIEINEKNLANKQAVKCQKEIRFKY